jgi:hypothetical protein
VSCPELVVLLMSCIEIASITTPTSAGTRRLNIAERKRAAVAMDKMHFSGAACVSSLRMLKLLLFSSCVLVVSLSSSAFSSSSMARKGVSSLASAAVAGESISPSCGYIGRCHGGCACVVPLRLIPDHVPSLLHCPERLVQ